MSELNNIELRSEKVRNIVGQIPPIIIRSGISIIFIVIIGLLLGSYLFKYDTKINVVSILHQQNDTIYYSLYIPYAKVNKIREGQKMIFTIQNNYCFNSTIQNIGTTLIVNNTDTFIQINGKLHNSKTSFIEPTKVNTIIYTGKTCLFNQLLNIMKRP